jgi:molecular chaperone GrpE (heat shock protein)
MPWQPGQSGNPSGAPKQAKIWKDAITRAIKRREADDPQALEKLADKLLSAVEAGDVGAMKEFGDRLDGKVAQAIIGGDEDDPAIQTVTRIELVGVRATD